MRKESELKELKYSTKNTKISEIKVNNNSSHP
jgi:hypothetical protein